MESLLTELQDRCATHLRRSSEKLLSQRIPNYSRVNQLRGIVTPTKDPVVGLAGFKSISFEYQDPFAFSAVLRFELKILSCVYFVTTHIHSHSHENCYFTRMCEIAHVSYSKILKRTPMVLNLSLFF